MFNRLHDSRKWFSCVESRLFLLGLSDFDFIVKSLCKVSFKVVAEVLFVCGGFVESAPTETDSPTSDS